MYVEHTIFTHRYNVTLIGIRAAGTSDLKLNPGLDNILNADDSVYYIAYASEQHSKLRGPVQRHTLWHACANFALIAMGTSGINPYKEHWVREVNSKPPHTLTEEVAEEKKEDLGKMFFLDDSSEVCKISSNSDLRSVDANHGNPKIRLEGTPDISLGDGRDICLTNELDDQQKCDIMRGVRLLRFHSLAGPTSTGIPVKVNLIHRDSSSNLQSHPPIIKHSSIVEFRSEPSTQPSKAVKLLQQQQQKSGKMEGMEGLPLLCTDKNYSFTSTKSGKSVLCDLMEETAVDEQGRGTNKKEVCPSYQVAITLEEDGKGSSHVRSNRESSSSSNHTTSAIFKAPRILKQMSTPNNITKHFNNKPPIHLFPPPSTNHLSPVAPLDSSIARCASEGKLKGGTQESDRCESYQRLEEEGGGVGGEMYASELNLLTPTSLNKHFSLAGAFSSDQSPQNKAYFRGRSRGISLADRNPINSSSLPEKASGIKNPPTLLIIPILHSVCNVQHISVWSQA